MATTKEKIAAKKLLETATANTAALSEPKFSLVTLTDAAGHKAGDTLTLLRHIAEYIRAVLDEGNETPSKLTDDQIIAGVKHVDVTGMNAEDAEVARIEYLEGLNPETLSDDAQVPSDVGAVVGGIAVDPIASEARALGAQAGAEIIGAITVGVNGKRDWNGAPVLLEGAMERQYGKAKMKDFPAIGTRRQGVKSDNNTGRAGEIVGMSPEQWASGNSPVDYYKVKGTEAKGRYVMQWYAGTPDGAAKMKRLNQVKALLDTTKAVFPDTPDDLLAIKGNEPELGSIRDTLQGEITDAVNRISAAVWLWQFKNEIAERMPKVEFTFIGIQTREDGTEFGHDIAAKRKKPIQFLDLSNPKRAIPSPAYSIGMCKRMSIVKALVGGGTVASLTGSIPPRKKKQPVAGQSGTAASPTITAIPDTVEKFLSSVNGITSYVLSGEGKKGMIKGQLTKVDGGGEAASALLELFDYLKEEIEIENYRPIANAWQTQQAIAEGDRRAAEAAEALAKRETAEVERIAKSIAKTTKADRYC